MCYQAPQPCHHHGNNESDDKGQEKISEPASFFQFQPPYDNHNKSCENLLLILERMQSERKVQY